MLFHDKKMLKPKRHKQHNLTRRNLDQNCFILIYRALYLIAHANRQIWNILNHAIFDLITHLPTNCVVATTTNYKILQNFTKYMNNSIKNISVCKFHYYT